MGDKHTQLTKDEVDAVRLRYEVAEMLDRLCQSGRVPSEIRVLDLGCGRGATTLHLLRKGFDAYGVDVDPGPMSKGEDAFEFFGFVAKDRLRHGDGTLPFEKGMFDLVLSEQVLEHVQDLALLVQELARVTTPGGVGIHFFPAKWVKVEPHVFVPYIHWLPKSRLRHWWLKWHADRLPRWHGHDLLTVDQRVDEFYNYLNRKTYYRSNSKIYHLFKKAGFHTDFCRPELRYGKKNPISLLNSWRCRTFHKVILHTRKPPDLLLAQ